MSKIDMGSFSFEKPPNLDVGSYLAMRGFLLSDFGPIADLEDRRLLSYLLQEDNDKEWFYLEREQLAEEFGRGRAVLGARLESLEDKLVEYFRHDPDGARSSWEIMIEYNQGLLVRVQFFQRPSRLRGDKLVFLCHSSLDKVSIRSLFRKLSHDGFVPWLDEYELLGGERWEERIDSAIRKCRVVIICISPAALTTQGFLWKEIDMAAKLANSKRDLTLIPAWLEQCEIPQQLADWNGVKLFQEAGYDQLVRALRKCLGGG
jgi:hypothetical protein